MLSGLSEFPTDHFFFQFSIFEKIGNMTTNRSMTFIEIFDNIANKKSKINIDNVLENAPTQLKVSVQVYNAYWQKIQELFAKERQWMTAQMQMHIREVNSMFADERKKVRERYKEYDGCYLGHYVQWFFWFFFTIGIFVVSGGIGIIVAQNCGK